MKARASQRGSRRTRSTVSAVLAELKRLGRPERARGAAAYFKAYEKLKFFGVDAPTVRKIAGRVRREEGADWRLADAIAFCDVLIARPELEAKALGVCLLGRFRREYVPAMLARSKTWLARSCTDWASTDVLCGEVIAPLLFEHPELVSKVRTWRTSTHLYVRRASAVGLLRLAHHGRELDAAYDAALALGGETHHLLQKAAGWLLREAGTTDMRRLKRFLVQHGFRLSRTTVSYAIERFPAPERQRLLAATRQRVTTTGS